MDLDNKQYIIASPDVIQTYVDEGVAGIKKMKGRCMLYEGFNGLEKATESYGGEYYPLTKKDALEINHLYDDTVYQGKYIDTRDGIRYMIIFTYCVRDGKMYNEKEIKVKEL